MEQPNTLPIHQLEQRLGKKIALAMAEAFLHDTMDIGDKLAVCVERKDAAELRNLTHKLAGCSASIMDKNTHQFCRNLEDLGDDQSWDKTIPCYKSLMQSLAKTREFLTHYLTI